ncbi:MAG: tyrosine-type recombinase/integrase [Sulfitobacter sp.]|nr:tyrosine-type recombinase/integrase [Sulfitobacter sp.]
MNRFLEHLGIRAFSPATVRAYAFDLANFAVFLDESGLEFDTIHPVGFFDYLEWQRKRGKRGSEPAVSTMNRRISTVRSWFVFLVTIEVMAKNPVPVARRSNGLRAPRRGMLGHTTDGTVGVGGGRLVKQPRRLPESLDPDDVAVFLADLNTHRDRAMVLGMVLGGLRSAEVRSLRLADVDMGMRRVRVIGKGDRERIVPIDRVFFDEVAAYLRSERPAGCSTAECFVVLRGPTLGGVMTEAGMRKIFRVHRQRTGATRVRPHRLRHTYATELAGAGIDLLALRALMGHASPETTAKYVHLAPEALAAEFAAARAVIGR